MSIKAITFPEHLSVGSRLGPGYRTTIVRTASGSEYRNQQITKPLHRYDVRKALQTASDVADLLSFFHATRGAAFGFRFWDAYDHSTASDHTSAPDDEDVEIGTGDSTETDFQLAKLYSYGGETMLRTITLPEAGSVVVAVDGVAQTLGSDFTVDTATGIITFASAPAEGASVTAGCEYYVPCRFGQETDRWLSISGDQQVSAMQSIIIEEIGDGLPTIEMGRTGGAVAAEVSVTGPNSLSMTDGLVQRFDNSSGVARNLFLPPKANVPLGGPIFVVVSDAGGDANLVLADGDTSSTVETIAPGEVCEVYMSLDGSGSREWIVATS